MASSKRLRELRMFNGDSPSGGRLAAEGVIGVSVWGLTLNEWVAVATLVYFVIQIIILYPKLEKTVKDIWRRK
jgi:hypothetical protein